MNRSKVDWLTPAWPPFYEVFPELREEAAEQDLPPDDVSCRAYGLLGIWVRRSARCAGITDENVIDDLTAVVAMKVFEGAFDGWNPIKGTPRAFLNGIMFFAVQEHRRRESVRRTDPLERAELVTSKEPGALERASRREWLHRLKDWFERLTSRERNALQRLHGELFGIPCPVGLGPPCQNDSMIQFRLLQRLRERWGHHEGP